MANLLFEIGTEELPPGSINGLCTQIKENILKDLGSTGIEAKNSDTQTFYTPRRIAVIIKNLPEQLEVKQTEIKGPPREKAYDQSGNPNQTAIGFAKKYNLEPKDLLTKTINGAEYVFLKATIGGQKTKDILTKILPNSIRQTTGDKFMSWGNYDEKFSRPIRWILAILDDKVIDFSFAGITADKYSYGHRFISDKKIEIKNSDYYESELEKNKVIASAEKRKKRINDLIIKELQHLIQKGKIENTLNIYNLLSEDFYNLLEKVTNITEYPCLILCEFSVDFLSLPPVVINTVLEKHQKYFSIKKQFIVGEKELQLSPYFFVITNGTNSPEETIEKQIIKGNEKVAKARLSDAIFFLKEDLKRPFTFEERIKDLSKITFQKGLGSIKDKVERITNLSTYIYGSLFGEKEEVSSPYNTQVKCRKKDVIEVAKLCKLDLATQMVFEMPELQSTIGKIYAKENKYPEIVCRGIEEHYNKTYRDNTTAHIVGIADRLDNLISLFSINKIPTGSSDPFALRSQIQWIFIHIDAINDQYNKALNLAETINYHCENTDLKSKVTNEIKAKIIDFIVDRLKLSYLSYGEQDFINALLSELTLLNDINNLKIKITFLEKYFSKPKEDDKAFLIAAKRLVRIVEPNTNGTIDLSILKLEEEKLLLKMLEEISNVKYKDLDEYYMALKKLVKPINNFFDKVLVNDPDPKIKQTRQALLKKGKDLFEKICDFNQIIERS